MKHPRIISVVILLILICMFPSWGFSQGPGDPGGNPDVPIDGGLSLLLAAGVGYGAKKYRDHKKKQREQEAGN